VLQQVNTFLSGEVEAGRFITLFLARLDIGSGELSYASAGHPTGYVIAASGEIKAAMDSTTIPLGIDSTTRFSAGKSVQLEAGETVLLYTDGVPEAMSADGELFGEGRLLDFVRQHSQLTASELVDRLYQTVRAFTGRERLLDDFTVVIARKMN
jgi:sigma-B regulation protein RsbU (phosphoserine phosphatase)